MPDHASLPRVALAISAFDSDESVLEILRKVFATGPAFAEVIVVDSLGSGMIERKLQKTGWPVRYINSGANLGSAGNLDLRLRTAAETDCDWCFAINHDGEIDLAKVTKLLGHGSAEDRIGAVYPQLRHPAAGNRIDAARHGFAPFANHREVETASAGSCTPVAWSSSNGALYNLRAIRSGIQVWPELWMGWEDLALGWLFGAQGWVQLRCSDVVIADNYEYRAVSIFGCDQFIAAKPSWYLYYQLRNLIIIARRSRGEASSGWTVIRRGLIDVVLIIGFRDRKWERLRLLGLGVVHGLLGRSGKGPVP